MRSDGITPNGKNESEAELLVAVEAAPQQTQLLAPAAIRALLLGHMREEVAQLFGRRHRMVRVWILAFSRGEIDALVNKPRRATPKIKFERVRDLLLPVLGRVERMGPGALERSEAPRLLKRTTLRGIGL